MAAPLVLIANEPRAYREVLAAALPELRPGLRVERADPADLDAAVARLRPALVVCSRLTEAVRSSAPSWIVLYPGGENRADARVGGAERTVAHPALDDVLALVDAALAHQD